MSNLSDFINSAGGAGKTMKVLDLTVSGTWTKPSGVSAVWYFLVAGGGSGSNGRYPSATVINSGGGGGQVKSGIINVDGLVNLPVAIGAGGQSSLPSGTTLKGQDGGNSTITGPNITCFGGQGGIITTTYNTSFYAEGNGGGITSGSTSNNSGAGGGAGGRAGENNTPNQTMISLTPKGYPGSTTASSTTVGFSRYENAIGGRGIDNYGGGGCGYPGLIQSQYRNVPARDGGGSSYTTQSTDNTVATTKRDARPNSGGGGGGGYSPYTGSTNAIAKKSGNGADGFCKIVWFE